MSVKKAIGIAKEYTIFFIIIILGIIFTLGNPSFLTWKNVVTILRQSCIMGILGMGEMALIIVGGLNLSMGSCVALSTVLLAVMTVNMGVPWGLALIITILVNVCIGFLTGVVINKTKIIPMIGTLAISNMISGIAYIICNGLPISGFPTQLRYFYQGTVGILPMPIIIAAVVVILMGVVFKFTYFGRRLFATGSNREAARLSGINADRIVVTAYTICGAMCGIAGLLMLGRMGSGAANVGTTLDMDVLAALVIGGVSMMGGEGKVTKAVCGIVLITMLTNGMTLNGINDYVQKVVTGGVFLLAVVLDSYQHGNFVLMRHLKPMNKEEKANA